MAERFEKIKALIDESIKSGRLNKIDGLEGYSGDMLIGLLQRMSKELLDEKSCYLEIGVYKGLTLISNAYNAAEHDFYGIDNFAFFDPDGENEGFILQKIKGLDIKNGHLINGDYEDVLEDLSAHIGDKKVGVYFIDGPHDYRSQLMCLMLIKPFLADNAVIVVDDANYRHVRQANRDFLVTNPEFKMMFESYTPAHPKNMTDDQLSDARNGWWDGVNVIVKDEDNVLPSFYPSTLRNRDLYENEHILQSLKFPDQLLKTHNVFKKLRLDKLCSLGQKAKKEYVGEFDDMNTYSADLPQNNFNSLFNQ